MTNVRWRDGHRALTHLLTADAGRGCCVTNLCSTLGMQHRSRGAMGCVAALLSGSAGADAAARPVFTPGAAGVGDPYFPLDGNGGYDVEHYLLQVRYEPSSDRLSGMATLSAQATQNLSSFNLDLVGLTLNAVEVDGCAATWSRDGAELRIEPARGILAGQDFEVRVAYSGVPAALSELGGSGFMTTPDGALIAGEPHGASS